MTEAEMLRQLAADMERPDELYRKSYLTEKADDTGRDLSEAAAEWLAAHKENLSADVRWGMYHTRAEPMGENVRYEKILSGIRQAGRLYHGTVWPWQVTITDGTTKICGCYEFGILTGEEAKELRLVEIRSAEDSENDLVRMLRNYTMARSAHAHRLPGIDEDVRITTMTLIVGASDDRYKEDKVQHTPLAFLKLAPFLGNQKLHLFSGIYASPFGSEPEGISEEELIVRLEEDGAHPETLWAKQYVKREGLAAGSSVPLCRIISEWLVIHKGSWDSIEATMPELLSGVRLQTKEITLPFRKIRHQGFLPPFGRVMDQAVWFEDRGAGYTARPSMLLYDRGVTPFSSYSLLRMAEIPSPKDTLLSAALRMAAHLKQMDQKKLAAALSLPEDTTLEGRILLPENETQRDAFIRDAADIEPFLSDRNISLLSIRAGMEAMW